MAKALDVCGFQRSEVVHIGDSYVSDVEGARGAGIDAILLDRSGTARCPEGTVKVSSLIRALELITDGMP